MHVLEPKHIKLKPEEIDKLVKSFNISLIQLPKISINDPVLSEDYMVGDVVKIERIDEDGKTMIYYRVVTV